MSEPLHNSGKAIHELFEIGIILKGLNALVETLLGFFFLFVDVRGLLDLLINNQLVDDPNDFLATHLQPYAERITPGAELYTALYLLSHGLVKGVLVVGLLRGKMWSYPASIAVLIIFIMYQVFKYMETHSIVLALLTVFDLLIIWLIWKEYQRVKEGGILK